MQILIKGMGLIGSSLALAIKEDHPAANLIGMDLNQDSLNYALRHGVVDGITDNFNETAQKADVIILACPVQTIIKDLAVLAELPLKPNVIVTDVGSTKDKIMDAALPLQQKGITFIGGHPMAGSHKSGAIAGRANLFENAFYFLVPGHAPKKTVDMLQELLTAAHVKWLIIDSKEHDQIVGQISHLPHIVAAALVNETQVTLAEFPLGLRLAAGGFKSITRIASSDPQMWTDILSSNSPILINQLEDYINELSELKEALADKNLTIIKNFFAAAKVTRDHLGPDQMGSLPNFFDLFLNIPDRAGAIAKITKILAEENLSLININILEMREEIDGVLQLTFGDLATQKRADSILQKAGYQVIRRN
ncbi:prephenate dehydrogenase [Xylocopilactobacillus apis]|uniref:Prephenate dehydrogenase n=1 Tax=Xylocopilactobacillus apis TaxID=2932183 RepID=A0AAU9DFS4_9LACO|nr:prephenate dehydrogenase [Xylocopilactobacillus apis]BDR57106.1 prephenate dehydrogenase [Xylocopilactobacillus apis]